MSQERFTGTVKWFNSAKGYGFVGAMADENTPWFDTDRTVDIFVHYTGIQQSGYKTLAQGDVVEFVVVDGSKQRKQADLVSVVSKSNGHSAEETTT